MAGDTDRNIAQGGPDGGYGWVIALCGMAFTALQTSYFAVYGAVFIELVEYYDTSKSVIAWIGAVQQGMFGISGELHL